MHWLIAALIAVAFAFGWVMLALAITPLKVRIFNWHKWVGIVALALVAVRGAWSVVRSPPVPLPMPSWQRVAAQSLHVLLYLLMIAVPVSGWIYSNAVGYSIIVFGLLPLPDLVSRDKALGELFVQIHRSASWLLLFAVCAHTAAALKHHFVDRDDTLRRMLRWRTR